MLADALNSSPFAVLTFIAAPAILTNASSVLTLSTGNRFARVIAAPRPMNKDPRTPVRTETKSRPA